VTVFRDIIILVSRFRWQPCGSTASVCPLNPVEAMDVAGEENGHLQPLEIGTKMRKDNPVAHFLCSTARIRQDISAAWCCSCKLP